MLLDERLKICANFVSGKGIACDIGTDHAYLATKLILSGNCKKVIASDIKEGPLDSAKKTIEKYGITDRVKLVLSDGLENIDLSGVTDIIITGMGGETIIDILKPKVYVLYGVNFILQPMTKPELLRKWLYSVNIQIKEEKAVEVDNELYTVICAERNQYDNIDLTEYESIAGFFTDDDSLSLKYHKKESKRLERVSHAIENSRNINTTVHNRSISQKLLNGVKAVSIQEIYNYLDELYSFSTQEKWDNSGYLIKNYYECKKVLLTLDITNEAIYEARKKRIDLIISHHPVIFKPLRSLDVFEPAYNLAYNGISAICIHTNLDISPNGTNNAIVRMISDKCELSGDPQPFEKTCGDDPLGFIIELKENTNIEKFVILLKSIFGCQYVRVNKKGKKRILKIAVFSGSGGYMLDLAIHKNCDALVTGDIKHDVWIKANNHGITLIDCGHFYMENPVLWDIRCAIEEKFPLLDIEIAESSLDPCHYY